MSLNIYVYTGSSSIDRAIVPSLTDVSRPTSGLPAAVLGSARGFNLYLLSAASTYDARSGDADYTPRIGAGPIGGVANGGTLTLNDGSVDTADIDYDATADELAAALNALNTATGPDGDLVTVTKPSAGVFVVRWSAVGVRPLLSGDAEQLTPDCGVVVDRTRTGSGTVYEEQTIRLARQPAIYADSLTPIANGWSGTLNVNNARALALLAGAKSVTTDFEIEIEGPSGPPDVVARSTINITGEIVNIGALVADDLPNAVLSDEFDAHASRHAAGGEDPITPADIAAATAAQGTKADNALPLAQFDTYFQSAIDTDNDQVDGLWTWVNGLILEGSNPLATVKLDTDDTNLTVEGDPVLTDQTGYTQSAADALLAAKQDALSIPSQAEAEAGTATTARAWTAERVRQAITALGTEVSIDLLHADQHKIGGSDPITPEDIGAMAGSMVMTTVNEGRPVVTDVNYDVSPTAPIEQTTDYHGVDITMRTQGAQIGSATTRLYPFEVLTQHATDDALNTAVPIYSFWSNIANGNIVQIRGLRMFGRNSGSGTIGEAVYINMEAPDNTGGGTITKLRGLVIEDMSSKSSDAMGLEVDEARNYMAGLTVGSTEVEPALYRRSAEGVQFAAAAGHAITGGFALGTGDFSWSRVVALDDYTPWGGAVLWSSHSAGNNRVEIALKYESDLRLTFYDSAGTATDYDILSNGALINGREHRFTVTVDRDGLARWYLDNTLLGAISVAASSAIDLGSGNANNSVFFTHSKLSGCDLGGAMFNFSMTNVPARAVRTTFLSASDRAGEMHGATASSDFTASNDGWIDTRFTSTYNETVGGITGCRKSTVGATTSSHYTQNVTLLPVGKTYTIQCDIYVPSANAVVDGVLFSFNAGASATTQFTPTPDTWVTVSFEQHVDAAWLSKLFIWALDGTSSSIAGNSTDYIAYKNIRATVKGAVLYQPANEGNGSTVHDYSGHSNHSTLTGDYYHLSPRQ